MPIKSRIKEVRQAVNLTQSKFAERIAISTSYLAGIELGDKNYNERVIKLICTEFNVNENWLRTGEGEMFIADTDARLSQVVSLFKSLDRAFQDCAIAQLGELEKLYNSQK